MGRKPSVAEEELMTRLTAVFRDVGYEGATLAMLAKASGLQKASLYHRFPGGKEQMAREVLEAAGSWLEDNVLLPLKGKGMPAARIGAMAKRLDEFYAGGHQACLLNMLASARIDDGAFTQLIKKGFDAWIVALAAVAAEAGFDRKASRARAQRAVIMLQGSLVLSRGMGTTRPFRAFLKSLPDELLGAANA